MTRLAALLCGSLWLAVAGGQQIFAIKEPSHFKTAPLAVGRVSQSLIPFSLDFLSVPNRTDPDVIEKHRTSIWESSVYVYDNDNFVESYASLAWPGGQGPRADGSRRSSKPWNACVVAVPGLFDRLVVKGQGDGTCFDVAEDYCVSAVMSYARTMLQISLNSVDNVDDSDEIEQACRAIRELPISPDCFREKTENTNVQVYANSNPRNDQPFMIALDNYGKDGANKESVLKKAVSRVWPLIVLESQGKKMIASSITCPYAGLNSPPKKTTPSVDGTCGRPSGYSCKGTSVFYGNCCGAEGMCGYSEEDCTDTLGCQPEYGLCDTTVTVTAQPTTTTSIAAKPTVGFHVKTFERQVCGGKVHNVKEVGMNEDMCIDTDCEVGGLDTTGTGLCPDGEIQISYWQNAGCSGDWYGYEYTSRNTCKALWSQGWKFKSLHLRCTAKKTDCISKGSCNIDREPAVGVCEAPPPKPDLAFSAKSHSSAQCSGSIKNNVEVKQGTNGFCVNTACQAASFDVAAQGSCPDGHVQISYWEQADCRGEWYGYGYTSRGTCRTLWSGGTLFKSVWMKCTDPKNDCVNQGSCRMDPEPTVGKC